MAAMITAKEIKMAKYVYNEDKVQTFNSAIGIIFGDNVRNKIETSIHKADEKEHKLMVTYDDLIRLWNYGVEHGIEGYKKYSCEESIEAKENHIKELEQQIEQMKVGQNCKQFGNCIYSKCPCDKWTFYKEKR